jgi:hypothetical protein
MVYSFKALVRLEKNSISAIDRKSPSWISNVTGILVKVKGKLSLCFN